MNVVVDTNVLIGEALREAGRQMLGHPALSFFQAADAAAETAYELERRFDRLAAADAIPADVLAERRRTLPALLRQAVQVIRRPIYASREEEARERIPADPDDWPTIALALELDAAILTHDRDFFGCGLPVWRPETLRAYLRRLGRRSALALDAGHDDAAHEVALGGEEEDAGSAGWRSSAAAISRCSRRLAGPRSASVWK